MLKYVDVLVSFQEVPDEISLCINISGCKCACPGCHSPWLAKDIGKILNSGELFNLVQKNKGITCVCLMGGDSDPKQINDLAADIKRWGLKSAWYSGRQYLHDDTNIKFFDYIKLGPYIEKLGGLTNPLTNQIIYEVQNGRLVDITYKFWRNVTESGIQ